MKDIRSSTNLNEKIILTNPNEKIKSNYFLSSSSIFLSFFPHSASMLFSSCPCGLITHTHTHTHTHPYHFVVVAKPCLTLCDPMDCSISGFSVHCLPKFAQIYVHWIGDAICFILCHSLLLLPSIFLSIRVFSNESVLCIRWPKYWSFSFSISPTKEYSGLISFSNDFFNLLAV